MNARDLQQHLRSLGSPEAAAAAMRFFKTRPGQYGAGDIFLGLRAAVLHKLADEHRALALPTVKTLLCSAVHEERMLALLILVRQARKGDDGLRKKIFDLYLAHTRYINNWDLVDVSAPHLVGSYLLTRDRDVLYTLARSALLWDRRIAIVATQTFIRNDDFADTIKLGRLLLKDTEDLIHKAVGWMLREVGARHQPTLTAFLDRHAVAMPRTMLRYAIEHFPEKQRQAYLNRKNATRV